MLHYQPHQVLITPSHETRQRIGIDESVDCLPAHLTVGRAWGLVKPRGDVTVRKGDAGE